MRSAGEQSPLCIMLIRVRSCKRTKECAGKSFGIICSKNVNLDKAKIKDLGFYPSLVATSEH
jgi:hypothetical protein